MFTIHSLPHHRRAEQTLLCLHISASSGRQWARLTTTLAPSLKKLTPELPSQLNLHRTMKEIAMDSLQESSRGSDIPRPSRPDAYELHLLARRQRATAGGGDAGLRLARAARRVLAAVVASTLPALREVLPSQRPCHTTAAGAACADLLVRGRALPARCPA